MKILHEYEGYVMGSYMGRDDGNPETKYKFYESLDELAKDYTGIEGKYYVLKELEPTCLDREIRDKQEKLLVEKEAKTRQEKWKLVEKLKKELGLT